MFPDHKNRPRHVPEQHDNEDEKYYQVKQGQHNTNHSHINYQTSEQNEEEYFRDDPKWELILDWYQMFDCSCGLLLANVLDGEGVDVVLDDG